MILCLRVAGRTPSCRTKAGEHEPCPIALAFRLPCSALLSRCWLCPRSTGARRGAEVLQRIQADVRQLRRRSLRNAQKNGITLGFSSNPPEAFLDEKTKQAERHRLGHQQGGARLDGRQDKSSWSGCRGKSQVPALLSKRTDVIAGNIHHTPERDKVISFIGPGLLVRAGDHRRRRAIRSGSSPTTI